jgi:hypothetical protein
MTVPAQVPVTNSVAVAAQTVFAFNWRCDDPATVAVKKNTVLLAGSAYTVALNANQSVSPGGTITLLVGAAAADALSVYRASVFSQALALVTYGFFPAAAVALALDRIVMMLQELAAGGVGSGGGGGGGGTGGTLVPNEVPAGLVNSTNGTDGNGVFTWLAAPVSPLKFFLYVDGVRQPPNRYGLVGAVVTFNAGLNPLTGSDIRADYYI